MLYSFNRYTLCIKHIGRFFTSTNKYAISLEAYIPTGLFYFSTFARDMITRNISFSPNSNVRKTIAQIQKLATDLDLDVGEQ